MKFFNHVYVLDTSCFIYDFNLLTYFDESAKIYIPIAVINELDLLKTKKGKVGYAARKSIKNLYDCFIEKSNNLNVNFDINLNSAISNDENIIQSAIVNKAILLSNDLNMQILASAKGVKTINLLGIIKTKKIYDGYRIISEDDEFIDKLYKNKFVETDKSYFENEYLCIKNDSMNQSALARFNNGKIKLINEIDSVWGIKARTMEQRFVIDALLDDDIN